MSRTTTSSPAASPGDPEDRKNGKSANGSGGSNGHGSAKPGDPARRPGLGNPTPKAPEVGASSPPNGKGQVADRTKAGVDATDGKSDGKSDGAPEMPPIEQLKSRQLGRVLTKMGRVTREQVVEGLTVQKKSGRGTPLGRILIDLGYLQESDLNVALAAQKGYELIDLSNLKIDPETVAAVPAQIATTSKVLPIAFDKEKKKLTVVMASQENFRALDDLRQLMGYSVTAKIGDAEQIDKLIAKHYTAAAESMGDLLGELESDSSLKDLKNRGESIDLEDLKGAADSNPVRKLINLVLLQAIKDKASDIHFEPFEEEFKMRYRIDGVLYEMMPPPAHIAAAISSRLKVMAGLGHRRAPRPAGRPHRTQPSTTSRSTSASASCPPMFGESVVMRVLDRSNVNLDLDKIGLRDDDLRTVRQLINKPNGIVIVTGPTGSGKTTTLYSALNELNDPESKIITAEDPVEYDIDGLIQCQIKPDIELTFGRILARHAPPGPRRDPRRRNSGPRDRRDRRPGLAHRPLGLQHAPHQ